MSTTKLDSTQQLFLTLLVALIQTVSLFANFDVPRSIIFQPCFFSLSFLVRHFQVMQIQRPRSIYRACIASHGQNDMPACMTLLF